MIASMSRQARLPTAERQRQIAAAALRIVSTQGVHRLTAAALATEVGISDGAIFRHFRNMGEIVDAAIDAFEALLMGSFPPPTDDPLERLGTFIVNRLELVRERPELLRLAFNDRLVEAAGESGAARVRELVQRSVAFVRTCLHEAQSEGTVSPTVSTTLLVWSVLGVVRGAATRDAARGDGDTDLSNAPPDEVWRALRRFLTETASNSRSTGTSQA